MPGPIEIGVKRKVYTIGLVVSLVAFLVSAGWVLPRLGLFPPAVLAAVMTGYGFLKFAHLLATGPYVFRIDARGIHDRSSVWQAGRVPWEEIAAFKTIVAAGRPQIGLLFTDAARARLSAVRRGLMDELRSQVGADSVIPPEALGQGPADEHVALLSRYLTNPEARRELEETE